MKITELKNTIELMQSEDYKKRLEAEFYQVNIRYEKLKSMIERWGNNELEFVPTCPKIVYLNQLEGMFQYLLMLKTRAYTENIDVEFL